MLSEPMAPRRSAAAPPTADSSPRDREEIDPRATDGRARFSRSSERRTMLVALAAVVVALVLGRVLDLVGLASFDAAPYGIAVVVVAVIARRGWAGAGAAMVVVPLAVARCVLAPTSLSSVAPVAAAFAALLFLGLHVRQVRAGVMVVAVAGWSVLLVVPAIVGADEASIFKGVGVGVMWLLVFVLAASTGAAERRILVAGFVASMALEAVIAMSESFLQLDFTRQYIAAGVGGGDYEVGPNLLLGSWATRSFGTIGHPIPLSFLLVLALVVLAATWRRRLWPLRIMVAVLLIGGIAATGARSALFVLLAAAIVLAAGAVGRIRRHRALALTALGLVLAGLGAGVVALFVRSATSNDYSMVHRGGMVESAVGLLAQPIDRVLFGFGYNAPVRLHALGIIGSDDFNVVDNTLVTQAATAGLVGLVLLIGLLACAFIRGSRIVRAAVAVCFASMFFFDLQSWHLVMAVFFFVLACGIYAPDRRRLQAGTRAALRRH